MYLYFHAAYFLYIDQYVLVSMNLSFRAEKEKQSLILEIDGLSTSLDSANKAAQHANSKAESLDDQVRRLKAQLDDLTRQNQVNTAAKAA